MRSLAATPRRFGLLLAVFAAAVTVVGVRETRFTNQLRDSALARVESGEFVYTADVLSDDFTGVGGDECERLTTIRGISASGVERDNSSVSFDNHPMGAYRSVFATSGRLTIADQVQPLVNGDGSVPLLIGSSAAREMGLGSRTLVVIDGSPIRAVSMQSSGARTGTIDRSTVRVVAPPFVRGVCYVEFTNVEPEEAAAILPALLSTEIREGVTVRPLIATGSLGPTPSELFRNRPDRWLWGILVVMSFLPTIMVTRARRDELATYAMFGAASAWISMVLLIEFLILIMLASSIGLSALILIEARAAGAVVPALQAGGRYLVWLTLFEITFVSSLPVRQTRLYELLRRSD